MSVLWQLRWMTCLPSQASESIDWAACLASDMWLTCCTPAVLQLLSFCLSVYMSTLQERTRCAFSGHETTRAFDLAGSKRRWDLLRSQPQRKQNRTVCMKLMHTLKALDLKMITVAFSLWVCTFLILSSSVFLWSDLSLLSNPVEAYLLGPAEVILWVSPLFYGFIFHVLSLLSQSQAVQPPMLVPGAALLSSSWRNVDWLLGDWQCCCCLTSLCICTVVPRRQKAKAIIPWAVWSEWQINPFFLSSVTPDHTAAKVWWHGYGLLGHNVC